MTTLAGFRNRRGGFRIPTDALTVKNLLMAHLGLEIEPREYNILTKSRIKEVFETHMGAGVLDHRPYLAAASVLPMRTNNYVVSLAPIYVKK